MKRDRAPSDARPNRRLRLAIAVLGAALLGLPALSSPAAAGCAASTKTAGGTVQGEDRRFVHVLMGIEFYDSAGRRLGPDGCPQPDGYSVVLQLNTGLSGAGADSGAGLTKRWSTPAPSNTARVAVEVYPRDGISTDHTRYGNSRRPEKKTRISQRIHVKLPLNCGITHNGVTGSTGTLSGTVFRRGARVEPDRVSVFGITPGDDTGINGFAVAETSPDGTWTAPSLAGDQRYSVLVKVGSSMQRYDWVPLNGCGHTEVTNTFPRQSTLVVDGATFYVKNTFRSGRASQVTVFGFPGDTPISGDFDGNNHDDIGVRRGNFYSVRAGTRPGAPSQEFSYGRADDQAFVGDWNGDRVDTVMVRRGKVFYLSNTNGGGADRVFSYGRARDDVFVGDWNGDGRDTLAVRRGNVFYLRNRLGGGRAEVVFGYGRADDEVFVGDWDGDGRDTFAVRRSNVFYLRNDTRSGRAQITFSYGKVGDVVLVGDWDNDKIDTFAVHR